MFFQHFFVQRVTCAGNDHTARVQLAGFLCFGKIDAAGSGTQFFNKLFGSTLVDYMAFGKIGDIL